MHPSPNPLDGEAPSLTGKVRVNARDFFRVYKENKLCMYTEKILALYIYRPQFHVSVYILSIYNGK